MDPVAKVKLPAHGDADRDHHRRRPAEAARRRAPPVVGQETPPTLQGGVQAPVNVPALPRGGAATIAAWSDGRGRRRTTAATGADRVLDRLARPG